MKMQRLIRDTQGATLVEFAVTLPVFMLVLFGVIQVGLMLWVQAGLQHGVETAARCASLSDIAISQSGLNPATNPTPCYNANGTATANASKLKAYAAANSWGLNPQATAFSVGTCTGGNLVTASYTFTGIQFLFEPTLTARSCYPT